MKKIILSMLLVLGVSQLYAFTTVTVKDSISTNTTWTATQQYLLKGYVYVTAGTTLTIDPGVIVRGDKNTKGALIIERGAKIMANGTAAAPIVFTSNEAQGDRSYGDWGGIILCGKAPTNWTAGEGQVEGGPRSMYGGTDPHDNSGKLSYVRIEFAGIAFSPNNEVNGLTFCSVGDATQIDHIQVSYSGDDSYEWFGGTVNTKYMISIGAWDDDFDTDNQYSGKNQFLFSLRDPNAADQSGSKAFESDSYQNGTVTGLADNTQATKPVFSNVTAIGPMIAPTSTAINTNYVSAAHIRRGSGISILNSILVGYPCGVLIDESSSAYGSTTGNIADNTLQFRNNIIAGIPTNSTPSAKEIVYVKDGARSLTPTNANADTTTGNPFNPFAGPWSWLKNPAYGNFIYATENNGTRLQNPFNLTNPNPVPTSTSPICYNAKALPAYMTVGGVDPFKNGKVYPFDPTKPINTDTSALFVNYNAPTILPDFTNTKASDAFFTKVNYVGAFAGTQTSTDNWMKGWANFDPNNTFYEYVSTDVARMAEGNMHNVSVFPNPAANSAFVSFSLDNAAKANIVLVDMTGKVVKNVYSADNTTGVQNLDMDLGNVAPGLYFVTVTAGDFSKTVKLSVVK